MKMYSILLLSSVQAFRLSRGLAPKSIHSDSSEIYELEDTDKYTTSLNWTNSYEDDDYDGDDEYDEYAEYWTDMTGQFGKRAYYVCDAKIDKEFRSDQWLRTKFITVPNELVKLDTEVTIQVDFAFRECPRDGDCKNTFTVFKKESDDDTANDDSPEWKDESYDKLKTIAAQELFGEETGDTTQQRTTEELHFKSSHKGFYIAFKTKQSCMSILRVRAYVKMCPQVNIDLAVFEKTPSLEGTNVEVKGECVINAHSPIAVTGKCTNGETLVQENHCQCLDGYEEVSGVRSKRCNACPANTFRRGNMASCKPCPDNRQSNSKSGSCECKPRYREGLKEDKKAPCYPPASRPEIVKKDTVDKSISFSINSPNDPYETKDLRYKISVCTTDPSSSQVELCPWRDHKVDYKHPYQTKIKLDRLEAATNYQVKVSALNIVSLAVDDDKASTEFSMNTKQARLGRVLGLTVIQSRDKKTLVVSWEAPRTGQVDHYSIEYTRSDGTSTSEVLDVTYYNITDIVPNKSYKVTIKALNAAGAGESTEATKVTDDDSPGMTMVIAAGLGLVSILMIVICSVLCRRSVRKSDMKETQSGTGSTVPFLPDSTIQPGQPNAYDTGPSVWGVFGKLELATTQIQMTDNLIGEGEFSSVHKGYLLKEGKKIAVAVKSLKSGVGMRYKSDFLDEGQVLNGFDHPCIVGLEGVVTKTLPLRILTEYMENGSLDKFLVKNRSGISVIDMVKILYDVASGMAYLQEKGFIHRDLAARNILIDDQHRAKIADFGLGRIVETTDPNAMYMALGGKIAIKWTAPEAISEKSFSHSSDVWSFGVVMWEVLSYGECPYWDMTNDNVIRNITNGQRLPQPAGCPDEVYLLMTDCWKHNKEERPTFKALKQILHSLVHDPSRLAKTGTMIPRLPQSDSRQSTALYTTLS